MIAVLKAVLLYRRRSLLIAAISIVLAGIAVLSLHPLAATTARQSAPPVTSSTVVAPPAVSSYAGDCPEDELPASGGPVMGSVGLRVGGHPACGASGMLAPVVWSLTDGATGLPLDGRPVINASRNGIEYSVSPDNSLLAVSLAVKLVVIDLRTWSEVAVVDFPGIPLDPQFWSPDGSKLYLRLGFGTRFRTGPALFNDRRIWELDVATMALSRLPDLPFDSMLSPAVSGDGRLLYAIAFDRADRDYGAVVSSQIVPRSLS